MKIAKAVLCRALCMSLLIALLALSPSAHAQLPGNNAVWNNNSTPVVVGSTSFIDASVLGSSTVDICAKIYTALGNLQSTTNYPAGAGVIDARGINVNNSASSGGGGIDLVEWVRVGGAATAAFVGGA